MKPVGILGGTFDPVHIGHLITAQSVLEKRNLAKIIFIPCHISPHKLDIASTSSDDRMEMLRLATSYNPSFEISDFEIQNKEVSYSLNTIEEMKKRYDNIEFIIGYDNLVTFDKWYEPDKILALCKLVVMKRSTDTIINTHHKYFDLAEYVDTPTIEVSATLIREREKNNYDIHNLVPDKVKEYISSNQLYK